MLVRKFDTQIASKALLSVLVDGSWGEWSAPSACSTSCGAGETTRTRQCNNPPPQFGGEYCEGDIDAQFAECNIGQCTGQFAEIF